MAPAVAREGEAVGGRCGGLGLHHGGACPEGERAQGGGEEGGWAAGWGHGVGARARYRQRGATTMGPGERRAPGRYPCAVALTTYSAAPAIPAAIAPPVDAPSRRRSASAAPRSPSASSRWTGSGPAPSSASSSSVADSAPVRRRRSGGRSDATQGAQARGGDPGRGPERPQADGHAAEDVVALGGQPGAPPDEPLRGALEGRVGRRDPLRDPRRERRDGRAASRERRDDRVPERRRPPASRPPRGAPGARRRRSRWASRAPPDR